MNSPQAARATEARSAGARPAEIVSVPCADPDASAEDVWAKVMELAGAENERLAMLLGGLRLANLTPQRATIEHGPREKVTASLALPHLQGLLARALGRSVAVMLTQREGASEPRLVKSPLDDPSAMSNASAASGGQAAPSEQDAGARSASRSSTMGEDDRRAIEQHPLVVEAQRLFAGATIKAVRPRKG